MIRKTILRILNFFNWFYAKLGWSVYRKRYAYQTNLFGDEWNGYLQQQDTAAAYDGLTKGLDDRSRGLVDLLLYRFKNVLSTYPCLYPIEVFSREEFDQRADFERHVSEIRRKYSITAESYDACSSFYHSGAVFLPEHVKTRLQGKTFLDGGAYIGEASLGFLEYKPGRVYSFEPISKNFNHLRENVSRNGKQSTIVPVKNGLGDAVSSVTMTVSGVTSHVVEESAGGAGVETINIVTFDDFVRRENVADVGLIKLDVEGFEQKVIAGAMETIRKFKPVLLLSIYHNPKDFFFIKPFLERENLGYKFMIRKINPYWLTYDTMLVCYVD